MFLGGNNDTNNRSRRDRDFFCILLVAFLNWKLIELVFLELPNIDRVAYYYYFRLVWFLSSQILQSALMLKSLDTNS